MELVLKRDPLSAGVKKLSLAKLTNGYAAATHKDELLGGYAKSNLYNGVRSGGYAEPPSRPPVPMEEGGWVRRRGAIWGHVHMMTALAWEWGGGSQKSRRSRIL